MPKELAGNFSFHKILVKTWEDAHGDKRCQVKIDVDPMDAPKWSALSVTKDVTFNADVFAVRPETFGGKSA